MVRHVSGLFTLLLCVLFQSWILLVFRVIPERVLHADFPERGGPFGQGEARRSLTSFPDKGRGGGSEAFLQEPRRLL